MCIVLARHRVGVRRMFRVNGNESDLLLTKLNKNANMHSKFSRTKFYVEFTLDLLLSRE